jgi:hypothetical protein
MTPKGLGESSRKGELTIALPSLLMQVPTHASASLSSPVPLGVVSLAWL